MPHQHHHSTSASGKSSQYALFLAVILLFLFAFFEVVVGWWANSLTLMSDGGHMAADGLSLLLAAVAGWIATKPASQKHSYGLGRAEVLGAWFSSLFLVLIAIFIGVEAVQRLKTPQSVAGGAVILVAGIGVVVNLILTFILHRAEQTLNTRAAILHLVGDLLGSLAALFSGIVIYFTNWTYIDPILSLFVSLLILISSFKLLRETLLVLMEGVPLHLDFNLVKDKMQSTQNVVQIQDLHIWTLSSGLVVLTAYVSIKNLGDWPTISEALHDMLHHEFDIQHITLQPEVV